MRLGREAFLAFRSTLFVFLIPGTVAGYVPFVILQSSEDGIHRSSRIGNSLALCLIVLGVSALLRSFTEPAELGNQR